MYYDADVISYFHELQGVFSVGPKIFVFATERVKADFFFNSKWSSVEVTFSTNFICIPRVINS